MRDECDHSPSMLTRLTDGAICVWHRHSGQLIEKIDGHKIDDEHPACVNAVAWNTANPKMFASASDDSRVRMYVFTRPRS